jgi:hypothetical protein
VQIVLFELNCVRYCRQRDENMRQRLRTDHSWQRAGGARPATTALSKIMSFLELKEEGRVIYCARNKSLCSLCGWIGHFVMLY